MRLRDYEDWVLLAAALLAAVAEALQAEPRYATLALVLGAVAKALFSILSKSSGCDSGGFPSQS